MWGQDAGYAPDADRLLFDAKDLASRFCAAQRTDNVRCGGDLIGHTRKIVQIIWICQILAIGISTQKFLVASSIVNG